MLGFTLIIMAFIVLVTLFVQYSILLYEVYGIKVGVFDYDKYDTYDGYVINSKNKIFFYIPLGILVAIGIEFVTYFLPNLNRNLKRIVLDIRTSRKEFNKRMENDS